MEVGLQVRDFEEARARARARARVTAFRYLSGHEFFPV
jgi:hypothetical protein